MGKYGMLGLLEGVGRGMVTSGVALERVSLQQAEEQRLMNLERIRRDWAKADRVEDRAYQDTRDDKNFERAQTADLAKEIRVNSRQDEILEQANTLEETRYTRNRTDQIEDRNFTIKNREPSEYEKKMGIVERMREEGKITDDEYKSLILGTQKTSSLSQKDLASLKMDAREQAALEVIGKEPLQAATPEQVKAIDSRAAEIFKSAVGESGGGNAPEMQIHPQEITATAKTMVKSGYDPEKDRGPQAQKMKAAGFPQSVIDQTLAEADKMATARKEKSASQTAANESDSKEAAFLQRVASAQALGKPLSPADQIELDRRQAAKEAAGKYKPITPAEREQRREEVRKRVAGLLE